MAVSLHEPLRACPARAAKQHFHAIAIQCHTLPSNATHCHTLPRIATLCHAVPSCDVPCIAIPMQKMKDYENSMRLLRRTFGRWMQECMPHHHQCCCCICCICCALAHCCCCIAAALLLHCCCIAAAIISISHHQHPGRDRAICSRHLTSGSFPGLNSNRNWRSTTSRGRMLICGRISHSD